MAPVKDALGYGEKVTEISCKLYEGGKPFSGKGSLTRHIRTVHKKEVDAGAAEQYMQETTSFVCNFCPEDNKARYQHQGSLSRHYRKAHAGQGKAAGNDEASAMAAVKDAVDNELSHQNDTSEKEPLDGIILPSDEVVLGRRGRIPAGRPTPKKAKAVKTPAQAAALGDDKSWFCQETTEHICAVCAGKSHRYKHARDLKNHIQKSHPDTTPEECMTTETKLACLVCQEDKKTVRYKHLRDLKNHVQAKHADRLPGPAHEPPSAGNPSPSPPPAQTPEPEPEPQPASTVPTTPSPAPSSSSSAAAASTTPHCVEQTSFQCTWCPGKTTYASQSNLGRHVRKQHEARFGSAAGPGDYTAITTLYRCGLCLSAGKKKREYANKSNLGRHLRMDHPDDMDVDMDAATTPTTPSKKKKKRGHVDDDDGADDADDAEPAQTPASASKKAKTFEDESEGEGQV